MLLPDLCDDALLHLAAFLPRQVLSILSRTCHRLHDLFSSYLLNETVWLTGSELTSFAKFTRAGCLRNPRFTAPLRSIKFYSTSTPHQNQSLTREESISLFSGILLLTRHLSELTIHSIALAFSPRQLQHVLASLSSLRHVTLNEVTDEYQDVLADVHSQLISVGLFLVTSSYDIDTGLFAPADPRPFLRFHSSTIADLALSQFCVNAGGESFPQVRDLHISGYRVTDEQSGFTGPLVHLFPHVERINLHSLQTDIGIATFAFQLPSNLSLARHYRSSAKAWQAAHGTWSKGLRLLRVGALVDLYCLGLSCHVTRIDLWFVCDPIGISRITLADVKPRCLKFPVSSRRELVNDLPVLLLGGVSQTHSLDHLIIDVSSNLILDVSFASLLTRLGNMLRGSYVTHLFIYVDHHRSTTAQTGDERLQDQPTRLAADAFREAPGLLRLLDRNHALCLVFLEFEDHGLKAWKRRRVHGEDARWDEMQQSDARTILRAENMLRDE